MLGVAVVVVEGGLGQPPQGLQRFEPVDVEGVAELPARERRGVPPADRPLCSDR